MDTCLYDNQIFPPALPFHVGNTIIDRKGKTFKHHHNFFEVFELKEGCINHYIDDEKHLVRPHELCLIKPERSHCFSLAKDSNSAIMTNFAFTAGFLAESKQFLIPIDDMGELEIPFPKTPISMPEPLARYWDWQTSRLIEEIPERGNSDIKAVGKSLLVSILSFMLRSGSEILQRPPKWLTTACKAMQKKENYIRGLDRFIDLSGRTHEHLSRITKAYMGISPTAFVNDLRIRAATRQLLTSDKTIREIVFDAGFGNVSHFNRLFKARYGVSPHIYRKNNSLILGG